MKLEFRCLLDFMIPELAEGISGASVWDSSDNCLELEKRFNLALATECLYVENREISFEERSSIGRLFFDSILKSDKNLISDTGEMLLDLWFTNPEVLRAYGLIAEPIFPLGRLVKPTDWTILESVYKKGKIYRELQN